MKRLSFAEARKIDLVQYLSDLGFEPARISGNDYWYLSPIRQEKTPSFKVNRKLNVWFDHGIQKGGNLVNFGALFHNCSAGEFLQKLSLTNRLPFHQPGPTLLPQSSTPVFKKEKITLIEVRDQISSASLQKYLSLRKIPMSIANHFCQEADFKLYDKKYTVIGFQNNAGGYELRSAHFKGSSSPKGVTLLEGDYSANILVFEGFFDFLSYQTIQHQKTMLLSNRQPNFLILNSIGFIEKMKLTLEKFASVHLYLDRDSKGLTVTKELLSLGTRYQDKSLLYENHKDLNDYLVKEHLNKEQSQRTGRRL